MLIEPAFRGALPAWAAARLGMVRAGGPLADPWVFPLRRDKGVLANWPHMQYVAMSVNAWVARQIEAFESLRGERIRRWHGVEWAILENPDDGTGVFRVLGVACLQLSRCRAELANGRWIEVSTYQDDDEFGLSIASDVETPDDTERIEGTTWRRVLDEVPVGLVGAVSIKLLGRSNVSAVTLQVGAKRVVLIAAEFYEEFSGELTVKPLDESVLLFVDPSTADIDGLPWYTQP
ncbi:MAG: hypothetical protein ABIR68_19700 [Ilumatobacteraceae bacterium]